MEFNPGSGEPTYRLRPGAPGGSEALALAERLGLSSAWIHRAEELLGGEHRDLRRLLQEVEQVRVELAEAEGRVTAQARDLKRERGEVAQELEVLRQERKLQQRKQRQDLDEFRRKVTDQLRGELETIRSQVDQGRRKNLVSNSLARLFEDAPQFDEPEDMTGAVAVGGQVRHRSFRWEGMLEKVKGRVAEVRVRGKLFKCELEDLVPVGENAVAASGEPSAKIEVQLKSSPDEISEELNLVGHRVEPALEKLDRYLDQALLGDRGEVRIVHGFGSGRLRSAVRTHLRPHPAVASFRSGKRDEGGDGATVVVLDKR